VATSGDNTPPYKITAIKAFLYYDQKGTFSENIIDNPDFNTLWNTVIGEGSAGSPSNATMVVVEITGKAGTYEMSRQIEFIATETDQQGKKTKFKRTCEIGILNENGKYFAAFWLYDTGCIPLKLSARIVGQSQASKMEKKIEFNCGE
jgi:hypothetical protein